MELLLIFAVVYLASVMGSATVLRVTISVIKKHKDSP